MIAQAVQSKPRELPKWTRWLTVMSWLLMLGILLPRCYWLSDEVASRLASNHMDLMRPGHGPFREVKYSWAWDGSWTFEFDSTPPIHVMVDRHGFCSELPERGQFEYMPGRR